MRTPFFLLFAAVCLLAFQVFAQSGPVEQCGCASSTTANPHSNVAFMFVYCGGVPDVPRSVPCTLSENTCPQTSTKCSKKGFCRYDCPVPACESGGYTPSFEEVQYCSSKRELCQCPYYELVEAAVKWCAEQGGTLLPHMDKPFDSCNTDSCSQSCGSTFTCQVKGERGNLKKEFKKECSFR